MKWHAHLPRGRAGILDLLLLPGIAQPHRRAADLIPLLLQKQAGRRAVHAAGHCRQDPVHTIPPTFFIIISQL